MQSVPFGRVAGGLTVMCTSERHTHTQVRMIELERMLERAHAHAHAHASAIGLRCCYVHAQRVAAGQLEFGQQAKVALASLPHASARVHACMPAFTYNISTTTRWQRPLHEVLEQEMYDMLIKAPAVAKGGAPVAAPTRSATRGGGRGAGVGSGATDGERE